MCQIVAFLIQSSLSISIVEVAKKYHEFQVDEELSVQYVRTKMFCVNNLSRSRSGDVRVIATNRRDYSKEAEELGAEYVLALQCKTKAFII